MTGRHGNNPVRSDPCADCAVGSSPGSPPYRSGESKRSGLHDHQLAQIADHSLVRVYQRERKCLPETAREFRTQALRMCAILWGLWSRICAYASARSSEMSAIITPGRNCRRIDNHRCELPWKIINTHPMVPSDRRRRCDRRYSMLQAWRALVPAYSSGQSSDARALASISACSHCLRVRPFL